MFERFDIDDRNIFKVCVIATMSSGKSTFINSIIGEEVMPEKNEACTARTMAVLDNDSTKIKRVHILRKNGDKEIVQVDGREVLDRVNNDEDVLDFIVETNIESISNTRRALMLIDTPGVNNSGDERHGARTEEFLKQLDMGAIIYLMNATQLATNDDSILLQLVAEHVKKQNGNVKVFFVINKIDALDTETESIAGTVAIAKEYIENHGIKNPIIYPMSALAAKSLRMVLYRREMTRRERRRLEDIYENYQSKDNSMTAFAMTDDMSGETYEIGDYNVTAQELKRAIDNTGIIAIEKRIESYMREIEQSYSPEIIIKASMSDNVTQKYSEYFSEISSRSLEIPENKFNHLCAEIESNKALERLNDSLELDGENITIESDTIDFEEVTEDFEEIIKSILFTKRKFVNAFCEEKIIQEAFRSNIYFVPTVEEKEKVSAKNFFYMSRDTEEWKLANFGEISKYIEAEQEFYIFNPYEKAYFKVTLDNAKDIIPLLDLKLPIKSVKIAKLKKKIASINEISEYMKELSDAEDEQLRKHQEAEEQLKRTYKGVLFDSEEEKNKTIEFEQEVDEFCQNLNNLSYEEIYKFKRKVSDYPHAIFSHYITELVSGLERQESREKNDWDDKIKTADLEELELLTKEINKQHYSKETFKWLEKNIAIKRKENQRIILDDAVKEINTMDRNDLWSLKDKLKRLDFFEELIVEYVEIVERQYDVKENQELRELWEQTDQADIQQLHNLEKTIKKEGYQEKNTKQYFEMITLKIENIHLKNMESYCQSVEHADRSTLNNIKKMVTDEDCKLGLKKKYLDRISDREEVLDYEDLCELTSGMEHKTIEELTELYNELSSGKYNEKYIKEFLVKTRTSLEFAQYNNLGELACRTFQMDQKEIQDLVDYIDKNKFPDRVVLPLKLCIEERKYVLDMYELLKYRNDFNNMSLEDIDFMRRHMVINNFCQRSRNTYSKKLDAREIAIGYEKVSQRANFVKQIIDQLGISSYISVKLATYSSDYIEYLNDFFKLTGKKEFEEIPVLMLPECAYFAMTKNAIYCHTAGGYRKFELDDIQSVSVEKKFFSDSVKIAMNSGLVVNLTTGVSKSNSSLLESLLIILLRNINNYDTLSQYQAHRYNIEPLSEADFEIKPIPNGINLEMIEEIFIKKIILWKELRHELVNYVGCAKWEETQMKIKEGFGINQNAHLVMSYDKTFFQSGKEGWAIEEGAIHIKKANQNLISIPFSDIWEVEYSRPLLKIFTNRGIIFTTTIDVKNGEIFANHIDEYVKGIQFAYNNGVKQTIIEEKVENNTDIVEKRCPTCNKIVSENAKFCSQCGSRIQ